MTEKKNIVEWVAIGMTVLIALLTFISLASKVEAKSNENRDKIIKVEKRVDFVEDKVNYHEIKISDIDEMKQDIKDLKNQNTKILVALGRIEEKIK